MKAEDLIGIDIKTARKALNYQGPLFSIVEKQILADQGICLLEVRNRSCKKCKKKTIQEWVRNIKFEYWRCSECLRRQLRVEGIFHPPGYFNNHVTQNKENWRH